MWRIQDNLKHFISLTVPWLSKNIIFSIVKLNIYVVGLSRSSTYTSQKNSWARKCPYPEKATKLSGRHFVYKDSTASAQRNYR